MLDFGASESRLLRAVAFDCGYGYAQEEYATKTERERKKSPVLSATLFSRLLADFSDFAFVLGTTVFGEIGLK